MNFPLQMNWKTSSLLLLICHKKLLTCLVYNDLSNVFTLYVIILQCN